MILKNAVAVLPVSNYVVTTTLIDLCILQMKRYIQSDERSLVPITMNIATQTQQLLKSASTDRSVKIGSYKYLTLFCVNQSNSDYVPCLVLDNQASIWWYWELPFNEVIQLDSTEDNLEILAYVNGKNSVVYFGRRYV